MSILFSLLNPARFSHTDAKCDYAKRDYAKRDFAKRDFERAAKRTRNDAAIALYIAA